MEKDKKLQYKKNLQIFLMIFIPYVCFSSFNARFEILSNIGSGFDISFLLLVSGVVLILILFMIFKGIKLKEQRNAQFPSEKKVGDASEKISPEPIFYRISVAGKNIKFSMIFSIIILILDIILFFTLHNATILWGFPATVTKEIISYFMISISSILAMISIWLSLKPREQEKGKNLIIFGIQFLFFRVFLSLTYWRFDSTNLGIKTFQLPQSLFLVILIISCIGIGFSLLSGSKKDQVNILFFTFYFTLGNFAFFFGSNLLFYYLGQFIIISLYCPVIGVIVVKYRTTTKIKINLQLILYGFFISGSNFCIFQFIEGSSWYSSYPIIVDFLIIFIWIVFIAIQVMALIQLLLNSNNLKEKLSKNGNYIKMLYFIELIAIFPTSMKDGHFILSR